MGQWRRGPSGQLEWVDDDFSSAALNYGGLEGSLRSDRDATIPENQRYHLEGDPGQRDSLYGFDEGMRRIPIAGSYYSLFAGPESLREQGARVSAISEQNARRRQQREYILSLLSQDPSEYGRGVYESIVGAGQPAIQRAGERAQQAVGTATEQRGIGGRAGVGAAERSRVQREIGSSIASLRAAARGEALSMAQRRKSELEGAIERGLTAYRGVPGIHDTGPHPEDKVGPELARILVGAALNGLIPTFALSGMGGGEQNATASGAGSRNPYAAWYMGGTPRQRWNDPNSLEYYSGLGGM